MASLSCLPQKIDGVYAESYGEALNGFNGDVAFTPFDRADIGSMEASKLSELLLGQAFTEARLPEIMGKNRPKISLLLGCHDGRMAMCRQRIYRL